MKFLGVIFVATVLLACAARAGIPTFPENSIAPLYGTWIAGGMGNNRSVHKIGPKWITDNSSGCAYRYRYRITGSHISSLEGDNQLNIDLVESQGEIVRAGLSSKQWTAKCGLPRNLVDEVYVEISINTGINSDSAISLFDSLECDRAGFERFKHSNSTDTEASGFGTWISL